MFTASTTIEILLGGILRYVNPSDWAEVRLDLDNGASGEDKEYWRQDDTRFPLPKPKHNFEELDVEDGGDLISSRMPRKDIKLVLLVTGTSKKMLDAAFRDLYKEINRIDNCIEYKPEQSTYSLFYKTYQYTDIDQSDYFIHKDRSDREFYAYNVTITIPCYPFAESNWERVDGVKSIGVNDSFELRTGDDFSNWTETGGVTADIAIYRFGTTGCRITNTGSIEDEDYLVVDELDHFNAQLFVQKVSGTAVINFDMKCYDVDSNLLGTLNLMVGVDAILDKWMDLNVDHNPVIHPSDSTNPIRWPEGTVKCKRYVEQTGTAVIVLDTLKLANVEYIPGHQLDGAYGLVIPPGIYKGDVPSLMDIYFKDTFPPGEWVRQNSYTPNNLQDICALDSTHIYAVGNNGKIIKWNGAIWSSETSGVTDRLLGVDVLDVTHIWAVGNDGRILFGDGTTWIPQSLSAQTFVIVNAGMNNWTGNSLDDWDEVENGGVQILPDPGNYHSGTKSAVYYLGSAGTSGDARQTTGAFFGINPYRKYSFKGWELGYLPGTAWHTRMLVYFYDCDGNYIGHRAAHFNDDKSDWYQRSILVNPVDFPANTYKIKLAILFNFTGSITGPAFYIHWDDMTLEEVSFPDLYAVKAVASDNAVAVGEGGSIYSFDGSVWTQREVALMKMLGDKHLYGVSASSAIHMVIVGEDGIILHSATSTNWSPRASGTSEDLMDVFALDSTHVWAVGANGTILFCGNNVTWLSQPSPTNVTLRSVWAQDSTHVWAVGDDGVILFFNGAVWTQLGSGVTATLTGVTSTAVDKVWISGFGGLILHGINDAEAMVMTNLIVGQRKEYSDNFNPVRNALGVTQTELETRQGQYYRAMDAGATEDWLVNIEEHKGRYLLSIGACVSAGTVDQVLLTFQLKTLAGTPITSSFVSQIIDLSNASGHTAIQYFREIGMLDWDKRFDAIDIPTHYISENANLRNIAQSILLTAGALGADFLWVDCLTLIPIDRAFVELNSWTYNNLILDSHGGMVLASLDGSLDSAMIYDGTKWGNAPRFYADPLGVNMTILSAYKTGADDTQDYGLVPRLDMYARYKPMWFLVRTEEESDDN